MKLVGAVVMLRSRTMHRTLLCLMGVLLLGACAGGEITTMPIAAPTTTPTISTPATPFPETPVLRPQPAVGSATAGVSTPSASAYPIGCTPAEVEAFLNRFLAALNEGDMVALRAFFPTTATGRSIPDFTGEKFVWYSMTDNRLDGSKRHFVAYDLPILWAYFAERHTHQETLRLEGVKNFLVTLVSVKRVDRPGSTVWDAAATVVASRQLPSGRMGPLGAIGGGTIAPPPAHARRTPHFWQLRVPNTL